MANSAPMIQYRDQLIATFEEGKTWLRHTTVTEHQRSGNQATFLVAGSGGAAASSRGIEGLIEARHDDMTQYTATVKEWNDLVRKTRFNIFQSQGNQRKLMQDTTRMVLNRRLDQDIIDILDTATNNLGSTGDTMSLNVVASALTTLGENEVPVEEEDNMFAVCTPAVRGYLMQIPEFDSVDYVDMKFLNGPSKRVMRWAGFNWIFHPNLTGVGTTAEKCYFYHKNSIGSAFDMENLDVKIGYDEEQDYSWARASSFTGTVMLQQPGVVQFLHDASAI
jgi:hypothetical protein